MIEKYAEWVLKFRWLVIIASLLIIVGAALGTKSLYFNNDYRIFFSEEDPHLQAFMKIQDAYTKNDNILMVIAPDDGVVFKPKTLEAIQDITERAWETPYSARVDSLSNYQHTQSIDDAISISNLYEDAKSLSEEEALALKNIVLAEPLLVHRLISEQAHVAAINITMEFQNKGIGTNNQVVTKGVTSQSREVVVYTRALKDYLLENYPNHKVYMTGTVLLNNAFIEAAKADITYLLPLALLLILGTIYFLLRSISGTVGTLIVITVSTITAFGLAGWLDIELSSPVMSAPIIILTLAVADCMHLLSSWISKMRMGMDKNTAMKESLRLNFMPIFLTSVTTSIGFLSLNASESPPFGDLGNITTIGVIAAFVFSISLLPALVTLLPVTFESKETRLSKSMATLAEWVIAKRRFLLVSVGSIAIFLVALLPKNELNDVYLHYFNEEIEFRTDTDFIVNNLTGLYFVDYSIETKNIGDLTALDTLADIEQFTDWLKQQSEVIHVNTITDIFKRLNKNMHGDDQSFHKLPESRELAAQYLVLYQMSLPFGLDLTNQIDMDERSTRITATLKTISVKEMLAFQQRVDEWMLLNMPDKRTLGASPSVMFAHIGLKNMISMLAGTAIALILISAILIIALRSFKYGLLSLVPNLVPAGMAFGAWALLSGEIGLGLSVVTAMTLGIVVDDTIHFISKYLYARRERGLSAEESVRYAFSTVGIALWVTSIALIAGFMVLSTSVFTLNADMGLLTAIVIALALVVDFLLLPPLLIFLDDWLHRRKPQQHNA